jgi:hypothetical protein
MVKKPSTSRKRRPASSPDFAQMQLAFGVDPGLAILGHGLRTRWRWLLVAMMLRVPGGASGAFEHGLELTVTGLARAEGQVVAEEQEAV